MRYSSNGKFLCELLPKVALVVGLVVLLAVLEKCGVIRRW